jgi:hypothetical protein
MTDTRPDSLIGYFAHVREASSAWAALVLVTPEGDPVDFLYTDPVALNRLTNRLLGPRLDGYLVTRVLLAPLLEQAGHRLSLLCFDDPAILQRRLDSDLPLAVFAPHDTTHKDGAWIAESLPSNNGHPHTWWLAPATYSAALAALKQTAAAMAPFGILEPFNQLRAAMAEVRGEKP